jgi:hypothetical protein
VDTYLVGEATRDEPALRLALGEPVGKQPAEIGLDARITRTRFDFPRVWMTREELFAPPLLVQNITPLRERAGAGRTLATARAGETLQATGMDGEWFSVRLADGRSAWVRSWDVYTPSRRASSSSSRAR